MKRLLISFLFVAGVMVTSPAVAGPIISSLTVDNFAISPNGDGAQDAMTITYVLSDSAGVALLVMEKDSTTVVDSLVAGAGQVAGSYQVLWDGTGSGGGVVPDDSYVLLLKAQNASAVDSSWAPVSVDGVPPQVTFTSVFPNPFAPGSPQVGQTTLYVDFDLNDPAPSIALLTDVEIVDAANLTIGTLTKAASYLPVSSHNLTWEPGSPLPATIKEGTHAVRVTVRDRAGNRSQVFSNFFFDIDPPTVKFTEPESGSRVTVVPDSLYGWTQEPVGIKTLEIRYAASRPYHLVTNTTTVGDTVFFAVALADSVITTTVADTTIQYEVNVRAISTTDRQKSPTPTFTITLDTEPPPAPVLIQPMSPVTFPRIEVSGTATAAAEYVWFAVNGVANGDTVFNAPPGILAFPHAVDLVSGDNRITATAIDQIGNESAPSNEVVVVLKGKIGLSIRQPFRPDESFQIKTPKTASNTTVRIYDLGGQLVQELNSGVQTTTISIDWNGKNGNYELVKRGPLVCVAVVNYMDGGSETFRELFLFEP